MIAACAASDDTADAVTMIVAFATNDDCGVAANDEFIAVAINVEFRIHLLYRKSIRKGLSLTRQLAFLYKKVAESAKALSRPQLLIINC